MRVVKLAVIFIAVLGFSTPALAGNKGLYFGIDAMNWTFDQSASPAGKATGTGFRGVFGSGFGQNLGWEMHLGMGGSGDTGTALGTISMDAIAGFFLRGSLPFNRGDIHGLIGVSSARFSNPGSTTVQSGLSYGLGAQFALSRSADLRADYVLYTADSFWKASAVTVGVNIGF